MNRRSFLYGGAVLEQSGRAGRPGQRQSPGESRGSRALMQRHSWEHGILAQAFLDMGDASASSSWPKARWSRKPRTGGWRPSAVGQPTPPWAARLIGAPRSGPAIPDAAGRARAAGVRPQESAARRRWNLLPRLQRAEMWSDSFYTTPPFLAATGHYDEAILQIEGLRKRLWSPEKKLLSHIWTMAGSSSSTRHSGESGTVGRRRASRA